MNLSKENVARFQLWPISEAYGWADSGLLPRPAYLKWPSICRPAFYAISGHICDRNLKS